MNDASAAALSDDELDELDHFLLYECASEEAMDIATLDGFLTAIVCGPKTILPSEWMPWVWDMERGEGDPGFKDERDAKRILGLLMRHYNDVAMTLYRASEQYEPLLSENPNDGDPIPILDDWCFGFMTGVGLDPEGWQPVIDGKPEWMSTILLYGTKDGWDELEKSNPSLDEHKALAAGLAESVRSIHRLWLERRQGQMAEGIEPFLARREPVRNPSKVGRNDPCPCGSGRKFKQCHGSPERLH